MYGTEIEQSIIYILEGSKDKIPFSRAVIDSIRSTDYPVDSVMLQRLRDIRELALLEGMLKTPTPGTYQTYLAEYPNGKFIAQVNAAENKRLYQLVEKILLPEISKHSSTMPICRNSLGIKTVVLILRRSVRFTTISCSSTSTVSKRRECHCDPPNYRRLQAYAVPDCRRPYSSG